MSPAGAAADNRLAVGDPSSTVLAELNRVTVRGSSIDAALARLDAVRAQVAAAEAAEAQADQAQVALALGLADIQTAIGNLNGARHAAEAARNAELGEAEVARARRERAQAGVDADQATIDELAVELFVSGGDRVASFVPETVLDAGHRARYLRDAFVAARRRQADHNASVARALAEEAEAEARAAQHDEQRLTIERQLAERTEAVARNGTDQVAAVEAKRVAAAEQVALQHSLLDAKAQLAEARRTGQVVGADFPLVVLDAFVRAARAEAVARPGCRLDWQLLAAISKVESNHGTYGGVRVDPVGQVPNILGPPLVPGSPFAVIVDTDGGVLDGDPLYDRAVGPMQFIPSSWAIFGSDGDGDGDRDPRNYYDAALAAAEHLCRSGADVGADAGRRAAVYGYNHSDSYVSQVVAIRQRYLSLRW